jgi:hypothetical protein
MPLIKGFESTTYWKAFILNALATTIAIFVAVFVKSKLGSLVDKNGNPIRDVSSPTSLFITLLSTFFAALGSYILLHFIFGFGGGMLATT